MAGSLNQSAQMTRRLAIQPGPGVPSQFSTVAINQSASGDTTLVAAVASQSTKLYAMILVCTGATAITIKDGASTSLTGAMSFGANGGFTLDMMGEPWFSGTANTAFIINSSNAVQVSGVALYIQS